MLSPVHEALVETINRLTEEQVAALLQVARLMQPVTPPPYDEASDPAIGLISGPTDLSIRAKDILRDEIRPRSGWTQKEDR